jgi:hypothetical protein
MSQRRKTKPSSPENARDSIDAAAIIDRLQGFVLGDDPDAMTASQVSAAAFLLHKTLPNLAAVDMPPEQKPTFVLRAPPESASYADWIRDYGPKHLQPAPPVEAAGTAPDPNPVPIVGKMKQHEAH